MKSASPFRPEGRLSSFFSSVAPPFGSVFGFRSRTSISRFFFSADSAWLFSLGISYALRLRAGREYQARHYQSTRRLFTARYSGQRDRVARTRWRVQRVVKFTFFPRAGRLLVLFLSARAKRRVFESADRSEADRTWDRAGAPRE